MAQTGYTPIQLYYSTTGLATPLPADLRYGELALNVADGKLYYKDLSNAVQLLVSAGTGGGTVTNVNGSGGTTGLTLSGGPITSTGTLTIGGTLGFANGGTGNTSYTDGQLLIGNTLTGGLTKSTLTAGSNITITNANGSITIASTGGGGGGVTTVNATYPIGVTGTTTPTIGLFNVSGAVTGTTGTGAMVCNISPTIASATMITPALGTPSSGVLSNATGLPLTTGVTGVLPVANGGTGVTSSTGSGNVVLSATPTISNATLSGHPTIEGVTSIGSTGSGYLVFNQAPSFTSPFLGTPQSGNLINCSGYTYANLGGTVPIWNQNTTGNAATATTAGTCTGNSATVTNGAYVNAANTFTSTNTFNNTYAVQIPATKNLVFGTTSEWTIGWDNSTNLLYNFAASAKVYFTTSGAAYNTTGSWGTISDQRVKENIVPASSYLDKLCQLNVVNYNLIDDKTKMLGFVAQQVETVMPGIVETSNNSNYNISDFKSLKTSVMIPMLVQAIKELKAEIDALKAAR